MIDGWPQFSDAVVDYYFGKKIAYHYIKRVQRPVCLMISEMENWNVSAALGNDSLEAHNVSYKIWDADSDEVLLEGAAESPANENISLGKIRVSRGEQRMLLMQWEYDGRTYFNHYLMGYPPFSLERYKKWLEKIALLDGSFKFDQIGK
jgi:beta-mannosidase